MPDYIQINNNEMVDNLIRVFENRCQSSYQKTDQTDNKNIKTMTLKGDKLDIVYDDNSTDYHSSPFFLLYFKEDWQSHEINGRRFSVTIKTDEIITRSGYSNILVKYVVKVGNNINSVVLNGRISELSQKQDLNKRVVEEVKRVLENNSDDLSNLAAEIHEDRLDISYRSKPNKSI